MKLLNAYTGERKVANLMQLEFKETSSYPTGADISQAAKLLSLSISNFFVKISSYHKFHQCSKYFYRGRLWLI